MREIVLFQLLLFQAFVSFSNTWTWARLPVNPNVFLFVSSKR
ncbi:Uncharacterized protein BM_BM173 [Brugia malayi]|uniref:Bm173 n=1 Tax=Brugia malayi TaxID=6279 RepID=A0A0K0J2T6_BRUMA|nr:Uncharacterized protein BM_BM173 [Brugia malayi]CDP91383.1 Bm173 [Brugia malayi]VIO95679.1 Uncharacterized protein BM_BM173 [Brugia malayi]